MCSRAKVGEKLLVTGKGLGNIPQMVFFLACEKSRHFYLAMPQKLSVPSCTRAKPWRQIIISTDAQWLLGDHIN